MADCGLLLLAGWTGLHCEDDINECLPQPCNQGMCIQNDPGHGYTCFCRPGFVGSHCEHNYDDCLLRPCPDGYACVDGLNRASCVPAEPGGAGATAVMVTAQPPLGPRSSSTTFQHPLPAATVVPIPGLQKTEPKGTDGSYVRYFGDSYLEFQGVDLGTMSTITIRFETQEVSGTLLYTDQGNDASAFFFIKLYIHEGRLQGIFSTSLQSEAIFYMFNRKSTRGCPLKDYRCPVPSGRQPEWESLETQRLFLKTFHRQYLAPCEAEVAVSGHERVRSIPSNYWSGLTVQRTRRLFLGGLPLSYLPYKGAEPFYNYSGCMEVIEINKLRGFFISTSISGSNVKNCRHEWNNDTTTIASTPRQQSTRPTVRSVTNQPAWSSPPPPLYPSSVACHEGLCRNGGTCHQLRRPTGALSFRCDCPLHFSGRFCEKGTARPDGSFRTVIKCDGANSLKRVMGQMALSASGLIWG
ncbi:hypothetical protein ACEWY4_020996 [Coilia grayii]|uniref:Uncharacterized protein n=1 Tax=Coilia grayii TaxID=363190 RepID=A0ABD1JB34_9TELE